MRDTSLLHLATLELEVLAAKMSDRVVGNRPQRDVCDGAWKYDVQSCEDQQ